MTSTRAPEAETDPALIAAVDLARAAAADQAGRDVGAHVAVVAEDAAAATHLFEADLPGYLGWRWAVTVASAGPGTAVTTSEVVLLPGPDALVAPAWVPWSERVRHGDMGVGDLLPTDPDDPRLVPGYVQSDDPAVEALATEVGLGRKRVLSREGRLDAADRWRAGEFGPGADMAKGAPAHCGSCGFYAAVAGSLGAAFGVCANEVAPADGRVVHAEYGCGAHSEAEVEQVSPVLVADLIYDDSLLDVAANERTEVPGPDEVTEVAEVAGVDEAAPAETTAPPADLTPEAEAVVEAQEAAEALAPENPAADAVDHAVHAAVLEAEHDAALAGGQEQVAGAELTEVAEPDAAEAIVAAGSVEQHLDVLDGAAEPAEQPEAVEAPVEVEGTALPEPVETSAELAGAEAPAPVEAVVAVETDVTADADLPAEDDLPGVDPAAAAEAAPEGAPTGSTQPADGTAQVDPAAAERGAESEG
ncbi:DUF3027 domain-containing protein [Actinokineospora bangkokensis]|uniref:DUF3027 domain-containing protein n=1 Tax=Actinokineospora bangkokensis TaxID=1193682 RepID=UPI0009FECC23